MKPSLQNNQITRQNKILNALGEPLRALKKKYVFSLKQYLKLDMYRKISKKETRKDASYMKENKSKT